MNPVAKRSCRAAMGNTIVIVLFGALLGCADVSMDETDDLTAARNQPGKGGSGAPSVGTGGEMMGTPSGDPLGGVGGTGGNASDTGGNGGISGGTGGASPGGTVNTGGSSPANTCTPAAEGPLRDADGDGIIDALDPDDDNDGFTDIEECFSGAERFENPSFEFPVIGQSWAYVSAAETLGWETTDLYDELEIWSTGTLDIPSQQGQQHLELNAHGPTSVSQVIATIPGTTLRFAFSHRGRAGVDSLDLYVGSEESTSLHESYSTGQSWVIYEGSYQVPSGQTFTRFEFQAVLPETGSGNHLDFIDAEPICFSDWDQDGCVDTEDPD